MSVIMKGKWLSKRIRLTRSSIPVQMFRLLEDANVGGFVRNQITNVTKSEDGIVVFMISCWIESDELKNTNK